MRLVDHEEHRTLFPFVHGSQEDAESFPADKRMGGTLYRVTRTSVPADETTAAPEGDDWVFTYSTPERAHLWNKPNCYSPWGLERFDSLSWTFPEPMEPIERAARANQDPRTIDAGELFSAYLLMWSVDVVTS
ncbi:hypothetical protein [Streptomyces sp. NPDC088752]|uniref:hypothetical protein n=1 Tax=Streptomyces sp. NPDC088752 TaxID=3154963 RepID=UPI00343E2386